MTLQIFISGVASIARSQLWPKHHKQGWKKELERTLISLFDSHTYHQHTSAEYFWMRYGLPDFEKCPIKPPPFLSSLWAFFHRHPVLCLCFRDGGTLSQGENWRNSCCWRDWAQAATQWKPSHKCFSSVWELVTATLELRRFHVNFFLVSHFPPVAAVQRAKSCIQKFFQKEEKFFSDSQTGTAWLIVKWRYSWEWGFRVEGQRKGGSGG